MTLERQRWNAFLVLLLLGLVGVIVSALAFPDDVDTPNLAATTRDYAILDPDTAAWWELASLPRVGENLARRIVSFREEARRLAGEPGLRVFARPEDLLHVRDLGPATLSEIRPYLLFPDQPGIMRPPCDGSRSSTKRAASERPPPASISAQRWRSADSA